MRITAATPKAQIAQFADAAKAIGLAVEKGAQAAINDTALDGKHLLEAPVDQFVDHPSEYTRNAFVARFGRAKAGAGLDAVTADIDVERDQSAFLKFGLGDDEREPGDVGPSDAFLFVAN